MTTAVVQATKSAGISELIDNSAQLNEEMSESDSSEPIQPVTSSDLDDSSHVYTNIREIEESNSRPIPPTPRPEDVPRRDMMNGWFEYETDVGRTFFYNRETGKSQWIPPRLIRTPAQVKAFLCATKSSLDEKCTYEGFSNSSSYTENEQKENKSSAEIENKQRGEEEEEEFDDVCDDVEEEPQLPIPLRFPDDNNHSNDGFSNSDFEEDDEDVAPPARNVQIGRGPELPSFPRRLPSVKSIASCSTPFQQVNPEREYSLPCPESHEPVRTIRCGELERSEKIEPKSRKREWVTHYMYLTTAHLILYKDQKSAEKHGKHYDAPQGVWDLRGASVTWHLDEKDVKKKQRMYIQLELCNAKKYLLRGGTFAEITEWFEALKEIVAKLPAPDTSQHVVAAIDGTTKIVGRNLSYLGSTRPLSHALIPINRTMRRRDDPMSYSAIESRPTSAAVDESKPSKETILEKLRRFFRTRPTVESLKEKGIYKPEPVFGSTLSVICQNENSLVPKFIRVVTEVIESKGLKTDGIYRVSGNLSAVQKIRCQADQDNYKALVAEEDIHVLTGALKLFFRELSEPLFPVNLHKEYTSAMQVPNTTSRFKKFEELLSRLPQENRESLKLLLGHLNRVAAHSSQNRMQQHNLAIVFGPTLFHNGDVASSYIAKNKKSTKKKGLKKEDSQPTPIQSNSHLAFSMIMHSQIVQYLLESANKFEILRSSVNIDR